MAARFWRNDRQKACGQTWSPPDEGCFLVRWTRRAKEEHPPAPAACTWRLSRARISGRKQTRRQGGEVRTHPPPRSPGIGVAKVGCLHPLCRYGVYYQKRRVELALGLKGRETRGRITRETSGVSSSEIGASGGDT